VTAVGPASAPRVDGVAGTTVADGRPPTLDATRHSTDDTALPFGVTVPRPNTSDDVTEAGALAATVDAAAATVPE